MTTIGNEQSVPGASRPSVTLKAEIGRVATTTKFNGTALLDGSFTTQKFQVGANSGETVALDAIANVKHAALGSLTPPSTYINTRPAIGFTDAAAATRRVKDRAVEVDKKRKPDTRQHPDRPRSPPHVQQPPSPRRAPPLGCGLRRCRRQHGPAGGQPAPARDAAPRGASQRNDDAMLSECARLAETLREGWNGIADQVQRADAQAAPATA